MKKVLSLFSILVLVLCSNQVKAQDQLSVNMTVFEPLPEIDFAAFALTNNLSGAPRIIQISIMPGGKMVTVTGQIDWKKPGASNYVKLFGFKTHEFAATTIYNDDIGSTNIRIASTSTEKANIEENIKKGKPTGSYKISISVYDKDGAVVSDQAELNFVNPAQTLSIRAPEAGSTQDIGGVLAEWDDVNGVTSYSIRANVRKNTNQSFEEALKSGNPLINDKDVGIVTSVNLRNLLDREWLPGQEIVFQVTANISGPGGGSQLYSDIVNFKFPMATSSEASQMNQNLVTLFQNLGDEESSRILSLLQNGEISMEDVTISFGDGQVMTLPEFQNLMNYLETNPDAVISITYNKK